MNRGTRALPADPAKWIGGGVIALWAALVIVMLSDRGTHDQNARGSATEFQTLIGARTTGAALDGLRERALLPGMTESVGPSDYLILPGGFGIGGHGFGDAFPYAAPPEAAPRPLRAAS